MENQHTHRLNIDASNPPPWLAEIPRVEWKEKQRLVDKIQKLKNERHALILGHNYMEPALYHAVADVTGDSLELCRKAAKTQMPVLVFCGVEFMAETAKIINPSRTVLIPSKKAGCSLASSITAEDVRQLKKSYPGVPVVSYVNTYAEVKAETDICCTSGNAVEVVNSLDSQTVIFIPDEYLAKNVAKETGKHVVFPQSDPRKLLEDQDNLLDSVFIGWQGKCEVHDQFTVEDIRKVREQFPNTEVLAHPECPPEVVGAADFSGSTAAMIKQVEKSKAEKILLLTECSMADNILAANPSSNLLRLCSVRCPHMAQITLQDTLLALQEMRYEIKLDQSIIAKAKKSIDAMLAIG